MEEYSVICGSALADSKHESTNSGFLWPGDPAARLALGLAGGGTRASLDSAEGGLESGSVMPKVNRIGFALGSHMLSLGLHPAL